VLWDPRGYSCIDLVEWKRGGEKRLLRRVCNSENVIVLDIPPLSSGEFFFTTPKHEMALWFGEPATCVIDKKKLRVSCRKPGFLSFLPYHEVER